MTPCSLRLRGVLSVCVFALGGLASGCGDDSVTGQGGGGGTSTDATSSTSAAGAVTSTTSGPTTATTTTSGSESTSGLGGSGGGEGGAGGTGGTGPGTGGAGGGPLCPEQPDPYVIGDDTADGCADLQGDPAAPAFHVEFIGEPTETLAYDGTVALDYAFSYLLALPLEALGDFTLTESRCQMLAGDVEESCSSGEIDLSAVEDSCSMRASGRWGLDPSNVREGINTFDFTMTLRFGCAEVSDTFTIVVDYQPAQN